MTLWRRHPEGSTQLVLAERDQRRPTHLLQRGDFLKPANTVEPGVPAFLNPLPKDAGVTRLAFAKWLVDRDAPTPARSLVNRVWQAYFGTGIVATSEDLGLQCEPPSHPELLDWLAVELMDNGWSLKHLHRLIVTSATYRQSSLTTPRARGPRSLQPPAGPGSAVPRRRRAGARHRASEPADCSTRRSAARAFRLRSRCFSFSRRPVTDPRSGMNRTVPNGTAAPSTRFAIGRCHTRCSRPSTHPTATSRACAGLAPTRRSRRSPP